MGHEELRAAGYKHPRQVTRFLVAETRPDPPRPDPMGHAVARLTTSGVHAQHRPSTSACSPALEQGTRKPATARKKTGLSVFCLWRVCLKNKTIVGSELRALATPVAGTRFSPRDGAPSPPPCPNPPPPPPPPPRSRSPPPGGARSALQPQDRLERTVLRHLAPFVLYMYCREAPQEQVFF
jgi:hypothetical protein